MLRIADQYVTPLLSTTTNTQVESATATDDAGDRDKNGDDDDGSPVTAATRVELLRAEVFTRLLQYMLHQPQLLASSSSSSLSSSSSSSSLFDYLLLLRPSRLTSELLIGLLKRQLKMHEPSPPPSKMIQQQQLATTVSNSSQFPGTPIMHAVLPSSSSSLSSMTHVSQTQQPHQTDCIIYPTFDSKSQLNDVPIQFVLKLLSA